ncbi:PEP-CTERM sorting domain-containing protein [Colwellia demingiae]|uniref:PEP-CTERM sorting domain-containing protein n=1 Tax=Colwellia demingiae TaxID=89401 RepID=UPI001FE5627A|nr:PEP-CTERM sorting domain-containing protein [Colwellia demingiae]
MNIKMLKALIAGLVLSVSSFANAGLIVNGAIESDGANSTLDHTFFEVLTAGLFEITLTSTDDPEMNLLFSSSAGVLGAFIENDDDDGAGLSSFISINLNVGYYALINGEFAVSNSEVGFLHVNAENPSNPYTLNITGDASLIGTRTGNLDGSYTESGFTQVPEPSTLAIFALGIMGLAARRFKK